MAMPAKDKTNPSKPAAISKLPARTRASAPLKLYLAAWRKKRGFTQDGLAERLNTYKGQISKLERGDIELSNDWIAGFAEAFEIEPAALFRDPDQPLIDDILKGAPLEQRRTAVRLIEALIRGEPGMSDPVNAASVPHADDQQSARIDIDALRRSLVAALTDPDLPRDETVARRIVAELLSISDTQPMLEQSGQKKDHIQAPHTIPPSSPR